MAYMNAEKAKVIRNDLKTAFPGFKFSVRVSHYTSIDVSLMKSPLVFNFKFDKGYKQINQYCLEDYENGDILKQIVEIINKENYDKSDIMSDYFDVGFYMSFSIGKWNKPYICTKG